MNDFSGSQLPLLAEQRRQNYNISTQNVSFRQAPRESEPLGKPGTESIWSPNRATRRSGVHLASKSVVLCLVFSVRAVRK